MSDPQVHVSWQKSAPPPDLGEAGLIAAVAGFLRGLGHGHSSVNLLLADDAVLLELNRRFRGLAVPTDVLSWSYLEEAGETELLGEIAVSLERGRAQARSNGWDFRTEVLRLLAHGCAHLAGYDHQTAPQGKKMRAVEIELLEAEGLKNLYPEG